MIMRLFQTLRWPVVPRLKQCHPAVCSVPTPHSAPLQVRLAEPGGLCGGGATPSPDSRRGAPDGNSLTLSTAQLHSPPQPRVWPSPSTAWYCSAHWLQRAPHPHPRQKTRPLCCKGSSQSLPDSDPRQPQGKADSYSRAWRCRAAVSTH